MPATFKFTYEPGISLQQIVGVEMAGKIWSSYLQDNTTINIHVGMSSRLPTGVIGGTLPGMRAAQAYQSVYDSLFNDKKSANDQTAVSHLSSGPRLSAWYDMFVNGSNNQGGITDTATVNLTRANAKALNLLSGSDVSLDGFILLGSLAGTTVQWSYDYSRSSPIASNSLDFLSTVTHEIGHALGFVSGIDKPGWLANTVVAGSTMDPYIMSVRDHLANATPLDFFRYSAKSREKGLTDISLGSQGGDKYFSINKGQTSLASFSTGLDTSMGGDGEQASHWKNGTNALMSPTLARGQRLNVSSVDLTSMDVIGWDVANVTLNFGALQDAAKTSLAAKLNPTLTASQQLTWMNNTLNNSTSANTAAQQLSQSRQTAIESMIQNSQVYNWGTDGDGWWQKVAQLFQQRGLFSTVDAADFLPTASYSNLTVQSSDFVVSDRTWMNQLANQVKTIFQQAQTKVGQTDSDSSPMWAMARQIQYGHRTATEASGQLKLNQFDLTVPQEFQFTQTSTQRFQCRHHFQSARLETEITWVSAGDRPL